MPKIASKTVGYLRVSKETQDLEKDKAEILYFADKNKFSKVEWIEEKVSEEISWKKRKIAHLIDTLRNATILLSLKLLGLAGHLWSVWRFYQ